MVLYFKLLFQHICEQGSGLQYNKLRSDINMWCCIFSVSPIQLPADCQVYFWGPLGSSHPATHHRLCQELTRKALYYTGHIHSVYISNWNDPLLSKLLTIQLVYAIYHAYYQIKWIVLYTTIIMFILLHDWNEDASLRGYHL